MRGKATVGVLAIPGRDDTAPWWPHLMSGDAAAPLVIARLPFAGPGNGRADSLEALVISRVSPEATGRDRSFIALDVDEGFALSSLGPALAETGLTVIFTALWDDKETGGTLLYLAEVDDFVAADDSRVKLFMDSTSLPIKRVFRLGFLRRAPDAQRLGPGAGEAESRAHERPCRQARDHGDYALCRGRIGRRWRRTRDQARLQRRGPWSQPQGGRRLPRRRGFAAPLSRRRLGRSAPGPGPPPRPGCGAHRLRRRIGRTDRAVVPRLRRTGGRGAA